MVNVIRLMDADLFEKKGTLAWKTTSTLSSDPVMLYVIPDIYLQWSPKPKIKSHTKTKPEPAMNIVLNHQTQQHLQDLEKKLFSLIQVNYWPSVLATMIRGSALVPITANELAFFYHDEQLTFFQRLKDQASDIHAIRQYLKRYHISIPETIQQIDPSHSWFAEAKAMWQCRQANAQSPLGILHHRFAKQRQCYRHGFITKASCVSAYSVIFLIIMGQYMGYTQRCQDIEKLQQTIVNLTPAEQNVASCFDAFLKTQENHQPVTFDFAKTIMTHWHDQVLITAIQWQPNGARLTIMFNPKYQQKIESFVDWIEGQPPSITLAEKDTTNGTLHILVKNQ